MAWVCRLLLIGLLLALAPAAASARATVADRMGMVGDPVPVCVRPMDARLSARALFAVPGRFDCRTPQQQLGSGDFDVLSAPLAPGTGRNWPAHVRIASLWQDRATLHALYADGAIVALPNDDHAVSRQLQLGAVVQQRLPVRGVPVVRLLWRVEGAANLRGIVLGVRVARPSEAGRSNLVMVSVYAGFAGLCVALLIYTVAVWCALRHRFQLAYAVMVLALLGYAFSSSGALAWACPDLANTDRLRINHLVLSTSAIAALAFARTFFEPRIFAGWLGRAATAVAALLFTSALALAALAPVAIRLLDRFYAWSYLALIALLPPILWRAWRLRSDYLLLFAVAWAAPIVLATLRVGQNLSILPWSFWLDHSTIIGMTVEALLSSIAVAYRIHLLGRERDRAVEREIAALRLAETDPLTGLLNRRAFLSRAIGREGPQTLFVLDLDHFKQVNEVLGHDGGDEVLRQVARALAAAVPPDALIARFGGEEFTVVADAGALPSGARLLDGLRELQLPFDMAVTASVGSCTGPLARETDWKLLYRRADEALFAAKAAGRDRARDAQLVVLAA